MIGFLQIIIAIIGILITLTSYLFLSNKPEIEKVVTTVTEEVVKSSTGIDIDPVNKDIESVISEIKQDENKN